MPKRPLNPGNGGPNKGDPKKIETKKLDLKKIEQLNRALDTMLSRADGKAPSLMRGLSRCCGLPPSCATCRGRVSKHELKLN